jgi:hypothetical protein
MERVDALAQEVRQLREQMAPTGGPSLNERVDALVREMHRRVEWWRATVAVGLIIVIAISGAAFLLELRTRSEIADANRKLCPLVALMIPDTGGREPTTEYGRQLVDQARLLYAAYGCPPKGTPHA